MAAAAGICSKPLPHLASVSSNRSNITGPQSCKIPLKTDFHGFKIVLPQPQTSPTKGFQVVQMSLIGKSHRWWEKGTHQNMKEIKSADDLAASLLSAGDKLVIVDFFSPGCGGCRSLHPKICQFAEMNPDVQFLQVNYEDHKSMCYSLNVHVLPFFRFYRGAHGRLGSFSCTNATIKKFKEALAKHSTERCGLGPTKGLEEAELIALAANRDLSFDYTPKPETETETEPAPANIKYPLPLSPTKQSDKRTLVTASGV